MDEEIHVVLERRAGFAFEARSPGRAYPAVAFDEPAPLGGDTAPNAARMLAAAVGDCLAASLLLCLQRSHVEVGVLRAEVDGRLRRNDKGRWRIEELRVHLHAPGVPAEKLARCRALFEDFCIVTQSVRAGLQVDVEVDDAA